MKRLWLLLPVLALGCAPKPTEPVKTEPDPVAVTVAASEQRQVRRTIPVTGSLSAAEDFQLSVKVDGRVLRADYDVGDLAVPGAVLLELEAVDYEKAVALERSGLDADLARLGLKELPTDKFDVEAVPEVQRAEAARVNTKRNFERLSNAGSTSKAEVDSAETEMKVGEANKRAAITLAEATLATARMRKRSLDIAEQKLADCKMRAPMPQHWLAWASVLGPGIAPPQYQVAAKMVQDGEMVRNPPGNAVYRLVSSQMLKLRVQVPEKFSPEVAMGQTVELKIEAYPNETFTGTIKRINPTVDVATRTFSIEAEVPNMANRLKPGVFARAEIITGKSVVTTVPPSALVVFAGVTKVFVQDGTKVKAVNVDIGQRTNDWVEVRGELPKEAKVVTSGYTQLFDGALIRVK
jgi:multidrug efflux pump subunit AcrA (membrane-fusion protein)